MVVDRSKEDRQIRSTLRVHGPRVMAELVDKLTPFLEEGEQLDLPTLPKVLARLIRDREERLTQADMARAERLEAQRRRRDQAAAELRRRLIRLRRNAETHYGVEPAQEFLVITGATSRNPSALVEQGRRVINRLRDPELTPPEPVIPGGPLAREEWADLLEPAVEELAAALSRVLHGRSKGRETLAEKRHAIEEHDRDVGRSARLAEALFGLADRPDLAENMRPLSPRQRRRRRQLLHQRQTAINATQPKERVTDRSTSHSDAET